MRSRCTRDESNDSTRTRRGSPKRDLRLSRVLVRTEPMTDLEGCSHDPDVQEGAVTERRDRPDVEAETSLHLLSELRGARVLTHTPATEPLPSSRAGAPDDGRSLAVFGTHPGEVVNFLRREAGTVVAVFPADPVDRVGHQTWSRQRPMPPGLAISRGRRQPAHPSAVPGRRRDIEWAVAYMICWSPGR